MSDATLVLGEVEDGVRTLVAMDVAVENNVNPMSVQHLLHVPLMLDPSGPDDGFAGLWAEFEFRGLVLQPCMFMLSSRIWACEMFELRFH